MNNRLIDLFIEFDEMGFAPTTVCPNPEETAIKWREQVSKEIAALEAENAELRARLDKAVELKEPDIELNPYTGDWELRYQEVITKIKAYDSREEAESRLAELKGGKK